MRAGEAGEGNLTLEALGLVLLNLSGPAAWPTPFHSRTGAQEEGRACQQRLSSHCSKGDIAAVFFPLQSKGAYLCFPKGKLRLREGKRDLSLQPSFGLELGLRALHREVPRSRPLTKVLARKASGEGTGPGHHRDSFLGPLPGPTGCFPSPTRTFFLVKFPHHLDLCSTVATPGKPGPVLKEGARPPPLLCIGLICPPKLCERGAVLFLHTSA